MTDLTIGFMAPRSARSALVRAAEKPAVEVRLPDNLYVEWILGDTISAVDPKIGLRALYKKEMGP